MAVFCYIFKDSLSQEISDSSIQRFDLAIRKSSNIRKNFPYRIFTYQINPFKTNSISIEKK